jgi:hypothetical protein
MATQRTMRIMTREAWFARGTKFYGEDPRRWTFRCLACGHTQSFESVSARNPALRNASSWIYFTCEGAFTAGVGCDWALGSVYTLHRLEVISENGAVAPVFEFADDPVGNWKPFMPLVRKRRPSARRVEPS